MRFGRSRWMTSVGVAAVLVVPACGAKVDSGGSGSTSGAGGSFNDDGKAGDDSRADLAGAGSDADGGTEGRAHVLQEGGEGGSAEVPSGGQRPQRGAFRNKIADKKDYVDRQPLGRRGWWRLDDLSPPRPLRLAATSLRGRRQ